VADAFDHARIAQHRQHTGADKRRFADAAFAEHQHERAARRRLLAERGQHVVDGCRAAEVDHAVFVVEPLQPAKR